MATPNEMMEVLTFGDSGTRTSKGGRKGIGARDLCDPPVALSMASPVLAKTSASGNSGSSSTTVRSGRSPIKDLARIIRWA